MTKFRVGDWVSWTSQAGGSFTKKCGRIVRVLSPEDDPVPIADELYPGHRRMFGGSFPPGGDEAYLVEVAGGKTAKARPKLYMPNPKSLERA